jgi:uncharacterized protein (DUF427 family)
MRGSYGGSRKKEPGSRRCTIDERTPNSSAHRTASDHDQPHRQYIPLIDVNRALLRPTDTATYCPYKGDASYYSVLTSTGDTVPDVIWTYERPYQAVAKIAGHVAFYPDKAEVIVA